MLRKCNLDSLIFGEIAKSMHVFLFFFFSVYSFALLQWKLLCEFSTIDCLLLASRTRYEAGKEMPSRLVLLYKYEFKSCHNKSISSSYRTRVDSCCFTSGPERRKRGWLDDDFFVDTRSRRGGYLPVSPGLLSLRARSAWALA